jgi:hypothetical protein
MGYAPCRPDAAEKFKQPFEKFNWGILPSGALFCNRTPSPNLFSLSTPLTASLSECETRKATPWVAGKQIFMRSQTCFRGGINRYGAPGGIEVNP